MGLALRREAIWVGVGVFWLDLISKWATQKYLPTISVSSAAYPYGGIGLFGDLLGIQASLSHTTNTGAAWGLGGAFPGLLAGVRIAVALVLWITIFFSRRRSTAIAMALIAVGALGNGLDYFWYGHVVDMVKLVFWGYHYPVFNVADMAICFGALIIFFSGMAAKRRSKQSLVWRH